MDKAWNDILHVTDFISLLIIFPGYMFILVVNILDWMKNKRLDISDQLISGLGLFCLLHRLLQVSFRAIVLLHGFQVFSSFAWLSIDLTDLTFMFCTLLFSTWLAIHFCLKIVNINQNLYIYVQHVFPKIFPWILLPSTLVSLLVSAPAAEHMSKLYLNSSNTSQNPKNSPLSAFLFLKLYFAFSSFCFLIFFSSLLTTIVSLYRHIQRMQDNDINFRAESVEAHVTAVKTLDYLLAFNVLYFCLVTITIERYGQLQWMHILLLLFALLHVLGILILIRGSMKLQKKLNAFWLRCLSLKKISG